MKKLLIINRSQFGYHVDTFKYCKYLNDTFKIYYLCFDFGLPRIEMDNVELIYVPRNGNLINRFFRFFSFVFKFRKLGFNFIFIVYFLGCSFLKIFFFKTPTILDIRTGADSSNLILNGIKNHVLKIESYNFKNVSIVSSSLGSQLGIKNFHELPLGGEIFSCQLKKFNKIHLLYVGTLENRNIIECVKGFHYFIVNNPSIDVLFTVIGDGPNNELLDIRQYIKSNNLDDKIYTLGYVPNERLYEFFENANVGVSFIPMTSYYHNQPPTKTFEYLLSGLPVIATKTKENLRWMKPDHGVFITDNAISFESGLNVLVKSLPKFENLDIRKEYIPCTWDNIVKENLLPFLMKVNNQYLN
jgi:glycosyltransferase involved in cell wall biosynthesis